MAKSKKQTLWVMLNEREIHKVYECTKYNGYTEVEDCTLPKPYNPLRYIVKNSQIVDDPRKLKDEIARLTEENARLQKEADIGKAKREAAEKVLRTIKEKGLFRYGGYLLRDSDFKAVATMYNVKWEE